MRRAFRDLRGQASVELVLAVPLVVLVALLGWQIVVAGHTWWKIAEVARLAARERYVAEQRGEDRPGVKRGRELAETLLAASPTSSRRVAVTRSGKVSVSARVPLVAPLRLALGPAAGPRITMSSRMAP
ncbi:MAG: TadE/TadG family type IV pilus assembly protein [Solirubrobacterales bacterium]